MDKSGEEPGMSRNTLLLVAGVLAITLGGTGCGDDNRLLSIKVVPANPTIFNNNTVYIFPGGAVQYQIQGWYSNRTVQTIASSSGKWTSTNTAVAAVSGDGLATSAGPVGVTTIRATFGGQTNTTVLAVCNQLCPPIP
jgi:hypothetical protein